VLPLFDQALHAFAERKRSVHRGDDDAYPSLEQCVAAPFDDQDAPPTQENFEVKLMMSRGSGGLHSPEPHPG
jgi:hypothetical protein